MTWPMILLAVGSVASGGALAIGGTLEHWLEPVVGAHETHHAAPVWVVTTVILTVVAVGIAHRLPHVRHAAVPEEVPAGSALTVAARQDLYGDAFNEEVFMRPGQLRHRGARRDRRRRGRRRRRPGSPPWCRRASSNGLRQLQTGFARSYALSMLAGAALVVAAILAVQLW